MWDVLKDYPAARIRLEAVAVKRLEKYKRAPLEKGRIIITYCIRILVNGYDLRKIEISVYYTVVMYELKYAGK